MLNPRTHNRAAQRFTAAGGLLALSLTATTVQALEIKFDNFGGTADQAMLRLNGDAAFSGNRLRLVPDAHSQVGSAFLNQGLFVQPTADFSTQFQFQVTGSQPTSLRSDGLALVIQGTGPGFIGQGGEYLGYRGYPLPPSPNFTYYAVEFDTYRNVSTGDLSDNEVAITRTTSLGTMVIASVDLSSLPVPQPLMDNGQVKNVQIEYGFHGIDRQLTVFLSEGAAMPQQVLKAILPNDPFHFGGAGTHIGFTAATGAGMANYDILSWQLQVPEPGGLALVALALLSLALTRNAAARR